MSNIRIIGDVHGLFDRYKRIIKGNDNSLQVGDMGVGFYRSTPDGLVPSRNPPFDAMSEGSHHFLRGNHDNPNVCKRHKYWVPDGTLYQGIFCLGGATSIDKDYRTEGIDYWSDEELSYTELQKAIDYYTEVKPDIVVTHEAPQSYADVILCYFNKVKIQDPSATRQALETMFHNHKPKLWIHGHWHHSLDYDMEGTRFVTLDELEYIDLNMETLEYTRAKG